MYPGDSLEVETSVNSSGIGNPGSLRGCQRQSQTGAVYSGGSLEVETSLKSFGTVDPGSLRVPKTIADRCNVLGRFPKSRN